MRTSAASRSSLCRAAPTPCGPPQSCPTIGNHGAPACFDQRIDEVAVEESPRGISVQKQHGPRATAPLVNVGHVAAVDAQRFLLPWEQLLKPCGLLVHDGCNRDFRIWIPFEYTISTTHGDRSLRR